jgi:hypothetical protein
VLHYEDFGYSIGEIVKIRTLSPPKNKKRPFRASSIVWITNPTCPFSPSLHSFYLEFVIVLYKTKKKHDFFQLFLLL